MLKSSGINLPELPEDQPDNILADYSGAGTIFGVTGGVMEAALRSAYYLITNEDLKDVNFHPVRGMDGVKEAEIDIKGTKVRIAVAHQLGNVQQVLDAIRADRKAGVKPRYDFIEVMACRGGCIGGGGQPLGATDTVRLSRTKGIYTDDEKSVRRCSHHNPYVMSLYKDWLGTPCGDKAHKLLHNHYHAKPLYKK
jgi:NADH-quinone oxidoreductase subunit G